MGTTKLKKLFLTGGTAGIGRATLLLLAKQGYQVVTIGRDPEKKAELLKQAANEQLSGRIEVLLQDLSQTELLESLLSETWNQYGPFDVVINNAAIGFEGVKGQSVSDITYLVNTNFTAYLYISGFFLKRMIQHQIAGDIINIGSMSADTRDGNSSGYVATKSGIQGFTEALRKEANPHGIRVALIEPGAVATDMQPPSAEEQHKLTMKQEMLRAEDVARAVSFVLDQDRRISISELQIKPLRQFI